MSTMFGARYAGVVAVSVLALGVPTLRPGLPIALAAAPAATFDDQAAHNARLDAIASRAIAWLRQQQDRQTGGWSINRDGPNYPAISALVLNGMLMQPGLDARDPAIARGIEYVLAMQQPDGGIYDRILPSYNTSIAVSMLSRAGTPRAAAAVPRALAFLRSLQFGDGAMVDGQLARETGRVGPEHPFYGGVGYGRSGRPDNSNLAMFIQAMADAGVPADDPAVQRALVFLQRTQMLDAASDMPYADGSSQGGFIYSTSVNAQRVGEGQSFAGEIEESASGPPGTVASVRVERRQAGPPEMPRAAMEAIVRDALRRAGAGVNADAGEFRVLLGPTADQLTAATFEVRTPLPQAEMLESALRAALDAAGLTATVAAREVDAWRGVSRLRAYGSMTYAGFRAYVYAQFAPDDPRVLAAKDWIARHYTLDENPGIGTDGLYYYFVTFARALSAAGIDRLDVRAGEAPAARDWRADLVARLEGLQNPDGSFRSVDDRWMESNPVLITAYALLALQHARK